MFVCSWLSSQGPNNLAGFLNRLLQNSHAPQFLHNEGRGCQRYPNSCRGKNFMHGIRNHESARPLGHFALQNLLSHTNS